MSTVVLGSKQDNATVAHLISNLSNESKDIDLKIPYG